MTTSSTSDNESILDDLLLRWEDARRNGQRLTTEELCQQHVHLVDVVRREIETLETALWMDAPFPANETNQAPISDQLPAFPLALEGYEVIGPIAAGGRGVVYKAVQRIMDRMVAIKVLRSDPPPSDVDCQRFQREIIATSKLRHPNIVTAFDAGEQNETFYLVMEYIDGPDLAAHVRRIGALAEDQAVGIVLQAAQALAHAHRLDIVHRDIKPANLLLDQDGRIRVSDFGLAKLLDGGEPGNRMTGARGDLTDSQTGIHGSAPYLAPEQIHDPSHVNHRADIYGLGATLYFLLTGEPPPAGHIIAEENARCLSVRAIRPDVSARIDAILRKMTAPAPEHRYSSMTDVVGALEGTTALRVAPSELRWPFRLPRAWWMSLAAGIALLATLAGREYVATKRDGRTGLGQPFVATSPAQVELSNNGVTIRGTSGNDRVECQLGSPARLMVNQKGHPLGSSPVSRLIYNDEKGDDLATIRLHPDMVEDLVVRDGTIEVPASDFVARFGGVDRVLVYGQSLDSITIALDKEHQRVHSKSYVRVIAGGTDWIFSGFGAVRDTRDSTVNPVRSNRADAADTVSLKEP